MKPLVAIVGRPNVGKSMLFNKLIGQRLSIVEDTPGVTRDRIYGESEWCGRKFRLVDTGGIEPRTDDQILSFMREQAEIAIQHADVIIFLTDVKTGLTASDQEVANMLLRSRKPIVLAVNKMDSTGRVDPDFYEFYNLGLGDPIAVSAVHGHGTGDLLDACLQYFPPEDDEEEDEDVIKVAIIGKPNVGKSSLTNRILGTERMIVSNVAGTTRDAIDSYFENETGKYVFIDTAGMRKKSKVDDVIERYSVLRATMAIDRADVCLIMIDAQEGVTEQDTKVAGLAHDAGKACIIVVNKWDLVEKDGKTMDKMRDDIRRDLSYMTYAPILFISAATGQRVPRLFEMINYVHNQSCMRISTGMLNNILADAQTPREGERKGTWELYYTPSVNGVPIPGIREDRVFSDPAIGEDHQYWTYRCSEETNADTVSWYMESVWITVGRDGILSFEWDAPSTEPVVKETQTALMPFEDIASIANTMLPVVVIGPSEARSLVEIDKINGDETYMDVEITKVSLSLMRIRDKGSLQGTIVPVWDFWGTWDWYEPGDNASESMKKGANYVTQPMLTLNAIDGNVVSRMFGY